MKYLQLVRIHHWVKNIFVFAPIFFHRDINNLPKLYHGFLVFISFCLLSSSIYIFNDLIDRPFDRLHPQKKNRPLASGTISVQSAILIAVGALLSSFIILFFIVQNNQVVLVLFLYLINNLLYTLVLKKIAVADISSLAIGFVLRIVAGGVATNIPLSHWIILMTFLLALFLGLAKRRDDVLLLEDSGIKMRSSVNGYNKTFIDNAMTMMCSVLVTCYLMYLGNTDLGKMNNQYIYFTAIPVIIGILRYMQITFQLQKSGSPVKILYQDVFLQGCLLIWGLGFYYLLYVVK